ncbi:MAG: putative membrane protein, partial [Marinobacter psychrophilus]
MDELLIIFGLLSLFVFVGSILGWVAFFRTQTLAVENAKLNKEINVLRERAAQSSASATTAASQSAATPQPLSSAQKKPESEEPQAHSLSAEREVNWYKQLQVNDSVEPIEPLESSSYSNEAAWNESLSSSAMNKSTKAAGPSFFKRLVASAAAHWMIWVGGASIGFSGIFFVKYSLDNNLL